MLRPFAKEIREAILSSLLGDIREFEFESLPWSDGGIALVGKRLATVMCRRSVAPEHRPLIEQSIPSLFPSFTSLFEVIRECLPENAIATETYPLSLEDEIWDEWLTVAYGLDPDTLLLASILPDFDDRKAELVQLAQKFPVVLEPASAIADEETYHDAHIHAGAMCPPSYRWIYFVNTRSYQGLAGRIGGP